MNALFLVQRLQEHRAKDKKLHVFCWFKKGIWQSTKKGDGIGYEKKRFAWNPGQDGDVFMKEQKRKLELDRGCQKNFLWKLVFIKHLCCCLCCLQWW